MKTTIVVLKLLFLGALFIISNHDLHLADRQERTVFVEYYSSWLYHLFQQGFQVTSYVVKFEWLPDLNQSYIEK